jgi:hypothetical protein
MSTPTTHASKTIEITVTPEGAVSLKTTGFSGSSCKDATRELERALGVTGKETLLPEFHSRPQASEHLRQGS